MQLLNINIGQHCKIFADKYDEQRITRQEWRRQSSTKEARRLEQLLQNEFYEEAEGLLYGPGIAN